MFGIWIEHPCGCRHGDAFVDRLCVKHRAEHQALVTAAEEKMKRLLRSVDEIIKKIC
jgi:hypothetical protein